MMLSVFMVMISVNAYQKNLGLSLSSVSKTVDSGEIANFTMDFKTTGSTQDSSKVNVKVDLPEGYELLTPLNDLSLMSVEPELVDNQLRYVLEDVKTGISQKNVLTFSTENGVEFNDEKISLKSRIIVEDEVIESSEATARINAVGNLTVAKVVADVNGKGKYAIPKKDSSIKWQLRIASDKQESAQLFIEPDSKIKLVDSLPKFVKYVSDSHGGEYDAASHTVTWYFDAPSVEEQKLSEDYLFLETIELETKVTGISGTSYYEEITNNAVGELTQLDGTKISRSTNASTTITGGSNVEIPAGGSWYRGNFRGPSDQNNGIASSTKPNPQIEAFDTAKLSFRHSYYIYEGTGTSLYVGNKKLGANETRNQYNIGFYEVAKKGYQFIDFTYDIGDGLVLETIRIRKPRLDIRSEVPDSEFIVGELPIATLEITTDDGRQFSHLIDFREFSGIAKTFNITDITGGEQVIVKSYKLKFRPNESQKNINGHFALPYNIMGYRVKPGSRGKVTNFVKLSIKLLGIIV